MVRKTWYIYSKEIEIQSFGGVVVMRCAFEKMVPQKDGKVLWVPDVEKAKQKFEDAEIWEDGSVHWTMGNLVPIDICEMWVAIGLISLKNKNDTIREREKHLEELRKKPYVPSEEDLFEMEAAFGKGTTVVNLLTNKRTVL